MNEGDVTVVAPDLVGLLVREAKEVGHEAAVVVVANDVDGPPLGALTWPGVWIVKAQEPAAGAHVRRWDNVRVTYGRIDGNEAGDREPRLPPLSPHDREAHAQPEDS